MAKEKKEILFQTMHLKIKKMHKKPAFGTY